MIGPALRILVVVLESILDISFNIVVIALMIAVGAIGIALSPLLLLTWYLLKKYNRTVKKM